MESFISRTHFANAVGVSLSTLARLRRAGSFPFANCIKVGRRVLYPASVLDQLMELVPNRQSDVQKETEERK
jgi:hypothetical protein